MKGKWGSRTFWLAVVWTAFVPLGMFIAGYMASMQMAASFMTQLIIASGSVVSLYMGKRAIDNGTYNLKQRNKTDAGSE